MNTPRTPRYRDPSAPVPDRVRDLLGRMTLREKTGQLNQRMYGWHAWERTPGGHRLSDAFRAEVAAFDGMGALYGLQRADAWSGVGFEDGITAAEAPGVAEAVQRHVTEHTRLGIPVLLVEEVPHGHQALDGTVLPVNLAVGAGWDPELYAAAAEAAAGELRRRGGHVALVSALDVLRDPRWGRAEECFGEDPYLAARFTEALVRGMRRAGAAVVLKHFAGQGSTVGGRNSAASELGARELHEIHLAAARAGIRAGAAGVMAAYSEFDGLPCVASGQLLTGLLRERWGFDGIVMADGTAVDRLVRLTGDPVAAGAMALEAGCDLSLWDACFPRLDEAVERGLVSEDALDAAVARVLTLKFRLGLFERPGPAAPSGPDAPRARELSERLARSCVTLLAHRGDVLPLTAQARRVAVLGPNADSLSALLGDYTAPQRPGTGHTVLDGVRAAAPPGTRIVHAPGCGLVGAAVDGIPDAVAAAREADVAVLVLGGTSARHRDTLFDANGAAVPNPAAHPDMTCGEGVDLADLRLPEGQRALLRAVTGTGVPVVVVLVQGRPHALPPFTEPGAPTGPGEPTGPGDTTGPGRPLGPGGLTGTGELPQHPADGGELDGTVAPAAVLSAWYPGPWGGRAVADVLFGAAEPVGRLPVSVPDSSGQLPVFYNGKDHGYRGYADRPARARFAFGHGLSYTTVDYGPPRLSRDRVPAADPRLTCRVTVRNTGERIAHETVQLYVRRLSGGTAWPRVRELRGFTRLVLPPGRSGEAVFTLDAGALASVTRALDLAVEPGEVAVETGPSSDRTRQARLVLAPGGPAHPGESPVGEPSAG